MVRSDGRVTFVDIQTSDLLLIGTEALGLKAAHLVIHEGPYYISHNVPGIYAFRDSPPLHIPLQRLPKAELHMNHDLKIEKSDRKLRL